MVVAQLLWLLLLSQPGRAGNSGVVVNSVSPSVMPFSTSDKCAHSRVVESCLHALEEARLSRAHAAFAVSFPLTTKTNHMRLPRAQSHTLCREEA